MAAAGRAKRKDMAKDRHAARLSTIASVPQVPAAVQAYYKELDDTGRTNLKEAQWWQDLRTGAWMPCVYDVVRDRVRPCATARARVLVCVCVCVCACVCACACERT